MLTFWHIGYQSASAAEGLDARYWEWRREFSEQSAVEKYNHYLSSYWAKDQLLAIMLVKVEFDPALGVCNSTVMYHLQKKIQPTVHYNKKENLAKPAAIWDTTPPTEYVDNPQMPEAPPLGGAPQWTNLSDAVISSAYHNVFNV